MNFPHQVAKYAGILDEIILGLYRTDRQRMDEMLSTLLHKQFVQTGRWAAALTYAGKIYCRQDTNPTAIFVDNRPAPHLSIIPEMQQYVTAFTALEAEKLALRQELIVMLRRCNEHQDIRDMLPDCAAKVTSQLAVLSREREVGFLFKDSPTLWERYQRTVEKMEMLSIVKVFY